MVDKKLDNKHLITKDWTQISAALDKEKSAQDDRQHHDLIKTAARELGWNEDLTIFMAHEYGSRNSLVHNSLQDLVEAGDWKALRKRCEDDQATLRRILAIRGTSSARTIDLKNWMDIINNFSERFVDGSQGISESQPNPIVNEGIRAGLKDWKSLNKLADIPKHLSADDREAEIQRLRGERDKIEAKKRLLAQLESEPELKDMTGKLADEKLKTSKLEKRIEGLEYTLEHSKSQEAIDKFKTMTASVRRLNEKLRTPGMQMRVRLHNYERH